MQLMDERGNIIPIAPSGWDHFKGP
jgi:hypothetical protein